MMVGSVSGHLGGELLYVRAWISGYLCGRKSVNDQETVLKICCMLIGIALLKYDDTFPGQAVYTG